MRTHDLYDRLRQSVSTTMARLLETDHAVNINGADNIGLRGH